MFIGPLGGYWCGKIGGLIGGVATSTMIRYFRRPTTEEVVASELKKHSEIGKTIYLRCLEILRCEPSYPDEKINERKRLLLFMEHPANNASLTKADKEKCKEKCLKIMTAAEIVKKYRENDQKRI